VLNARLEQVQGTLEDEDAAAADRSIFIMSALVGALLLSRSVENPELAQRILDVTREFLKQPQD
jgi:TetR/AcrR family transcriptional repressor of nem operon